MNTKLLNLIKSFFLLLAVCFAISAQAGNNEDLMAACNAGNLASVQKAVTAGADVNFLDSVGANPLDAAVSWPEIVKYLLSKKADPNAGKYNPLQSASYYGSYESMKLLLDAGADPNKGTELNTGAVYDQLIAAEEAKKKPNKAILKVYKKMADDAKANATYMYPISSVISATNCKECLQLLIDKGAKTDKSLTASIGGNLLNDFAASGKSVSGRIASNKAYAEQREKAGVKMPDWYTNPDASKMATPDEIVKLLIKNGVDINAKLKNAPVSPIFSALQKDGPLKADEDVIMAFLNNGAKWNEDMPVIGHPLLRCAALGYDQAVTYMLDHGGDQNQDFYVKNDQTGEDLKGVTPLMLAAQNGHLSTVKLLVERKANLKASAKGKLIDRKERCISLVKDKGVIFYAVESGSLDIVKYLWENTKQDWERHRLSFGAYIEDVGTMRVIYHGCHNALLGYGPGEWAKVQGYDDIKEYIKHK